MRPDSAPTARRQEEGYLLLGVLFMILLIMMALAIAAPQMAESIRRDKEIETVHRGMQYARAIQMYYNKFGRYPNTIDQLVKTENQRFLRKRYLDPMTGKDDWRLIHYGEAKVPTQGLFGQSAQTNGITPTGATNGSGASPFSAPGGSPQGGGSSSLGAPGSGFGSSGSSFGAGSSTSPFGGSGSSSSPIGGTDSSSASSFGTSPEIGGTTTGAGGTTNGIGGTQTTGTSSAFGTPGVSVGGAPIVGVGLLSKKTSIKVYRKQTHYNQWEFVFDPTQNTVAAVGGNLNGTTNGTGVNGGSGNGLGASNGLGGGAGNGSGFGSSNGSGFGSSTGSGFGGSPTSPGSPTAPTSYPPQ